MDPVPAARRVAVGGMAEIWLATDLTGRPVAVKRLLPAYVGLPEFVDAFVEEARLLELLDHPNIARVLELGVDEEPFLALEWIDGADLAAIERAYREARRAAPLPFVARVARDLLAALGHAHRVRGPAGRPIALVHRDVSPHNVMVGRDGRCRLIDFGVATAAGTPVTAAGVLKGKIAYLAPERIDGESHDLRADLFSAAVLLFELACGCHPFQGRCEGATLRAILAARPPSPAALRPDLADAASRALLRALARRPEARFPSAEAFAGELLEALPPPASPAEVAALLSDAFPLGLPHEAGPRGTGPGHSPRRAPLAPAAAIALARSADGPHGPEPGTGVPRARRRALRAAIGLGAAAALAALIAAAGSTSPPERRVVAHERVPLPRTGPNVRSTPAVRGPGPDAATLPAALLRAPAGAGPRRAARSGTDARPALR